MTYQFCDAVVLEHSHAHLFVYWLWLFLYYRRLEHVTKIIWFTELKIVTTWNFSENDDCPLLCVIPLGSNLAYSDVVYIAQVKNLLACFMFIDSLACIVVSYSLA